MAGLKWNTGKLYYSTVELGYQQCHRYHFIMNLTRIKYGLTLQQVILSSFLKEATYLDGFVGHAT